MAPWKEINPSKNSKLLKSILISIRDHESQDQFQFLMRNRERITPIASIKRGQRKIGGTKNITKRSALESQVDMILQSLPHSFSQFKVEFHDRRIYTLSKSMNELHSMEDININIKLQQLL